MPNTLAEVAAALDAFDKFLPIADAAATPFVPEAAVLAPFLPLFHRAVLAVDVVAKDTGKPFGDVLADVLNTLTPGMQSAPSLA